MSRIKISIATIVGMLALGGFTSWTSVASAGWMVNRANFTSGTKAIATTAAVDKKGEDSAAGIVLVCEGKTLKGVNPVINGLTGMVDVSSAEVTECEVTTGNPPCRLALSMANTVKTLPLLVDLTLDGPLAIKARVLESVREVGPGQDYVALD